MEELLYCNIHLIKGNIIPLQPLPSLQECIKPNLMSELPKPDCAWDELEARRRRRNRLVLLGGIIAAALALLAVS